MDLNHKTDQFFREKLDQLSVTPSEDAWKLVQQEIGSQKPFASVLLKVAAAITVLIVCTWVLFTLNESDKVLMAGEINHPAQLEQSSITIPNDPIEIKMVAENQTKKNVSTPSAPSKKITSDEAPAVSTLTLASFQRIDLEIDLNIKIAIKEVVVIEQEKQPIRITYIPSSGNFNDIEKDSTNANLFNRVLSIARNVSPIDVISDLREAKDGLFENGLKRN